MGTVAGFELRAGQPMAVVSLRVQVRNNYILTQNLYYNYYYPKPKYLIIGYLDPLGFLASWETSKTVFL